MLEMVALDRAKDESDATPPSLGPASDQIWLDLNFHLTELSGTHYRLIL